jgi:hypothetical protein
MTKLLNVRCDALLGEWLIIILSHVLSMRKHKLTEQVKVAGNAFLMHLSTGRLAISVLCNYTINRSNAN